MIYNKYTERIKNIVSENKRRKNQFLNFSGSEGLSATNTRQQLLHEQKMFSNKSQVNLTPFQSSTQLSLVQDAKIGLHPDFAYLKGTENTANHYIVSVFIDIQGSTNLFREYELEDIYRITNTVQSAAIHTCISFGGYVQRLQGDGVFAYFGGKNITKIDAVRSAVTACSMISYFVKNDLKNVFLEDGIEDIKTRIGIDFGDDDKVLWANFGLLDVSELTTLSLHTSLASKMQGWATSNGIVIGQNVKDMLKGSDTFFDLVRNSKGEVEKRYIYEDNAKGFRYTQYAFNWFDYLESLPSVRLASDGSLYTVESTSIPTNTNISPVKDYSSLAMLAGNNKPYGFASID